MPRDHILLGSAYRKAGIFAAYDPARPEDAENDDRGLGGWQDRRNWYTVSHPFFFHFYFFFFFFVYHSLFRACLPFFPFPHSFQLPD